MTEGKDALEKDETGPSFDSGIVGAALRTEHYEIAGYTATIAMAKTLGLKNVVSLLTENLNEELSAVKKILAAAQPILRASVKQPDEPKKPNPAKRNIRPKRVVKTKRKLLQVLGGRSETHVASDSTAALDGPLLSLWSCAHGLSVGPLHLIH